MNLSLLLAIALGAISGTTEAPVARTRITNVAAECGVVTSERAISITRVLKRQPRASSTKLPPASKRLSPAPQLPAPLQPTAEPLFRFAVWLLLGRKSS